MVGYQVNIGGNSWGRDHRRRIARGVTGGTGFPWVGILLGIFDGREHQ